MAANRCLGLLAVLCMCLAAQAVLSPSHPNRYRRAPSDTNNEAVVITESGPIVGVVNETARAFLGIPFAAPPTGANRWQPPQPKKPWYPDTFQATEFGPGCPQDCILPPLTCPLVTQEDCLVLDVYTPRLSALSTPRPVMVFFPGGDYVQGTCGTLLYDGSQIANLTDTIVVVTNYRLGALGFLYNDELSGNYGMLDQQYALQWVQRNIGQFGGDPNSVTLFGQSAGGMSTTAHMISPQSAGLFHRVITESNPVGLGFNSAEEQQRNSDNFARFGGCGDLTGPYKTECLRNMTVAEVLQAQAKADVDVDLSMPLKIFVAWTPTVEGNVIPGQPTTMFTLGKFNPVPLMIGTVHDEGWMFIWEVMPYPIPTPEYIVILEALFGDNTGDILKLYPVGPLQKDTRPQLNDVLTDYLFLCSSRNLANQVSLNQPKLPLYKYWFNHVLSFYESWGPTYEFCWFDYVCHASELPFVFDSAVLAGYNYTPEEQALATAMVGYWGNFAHTSDPNKGPFGTPNVLWPTFDNLNLRNLNLNLTIHEESAVRSDFCDYWDSVGYFQP